MIQDDVTNKSETQPPKISRHRWDSPVAQVGRPLRLQGTAPHRFYYKKPQKLTLVLNHVIVWLATHFNWMQLWQSWFKYPLGVFKNLECLQEVQQTVSSLNYPHNIHIPWIPIISLVKTMAWVWCFIHRQVDVTSLTKMAGDRLQKPQWNRNMWRLHPVDIKGKCYGVYLRSQTFRRRSVPLDANMVSLWGDHWTWNSKVRQLKLGKPE